ncbi:hypothetical protein BC939DRAFT_458821 [Gamsiella multidivaricata]|uniref:uncharacterized protein n=1 Tax=Gamsiella multidivaricata TaxID=101098 RepID=UPI00221FD8E4|nr:uncharacterized protein BC939DRAFT_458821 [Gamsiella multidivaricata]KAI7820057.1 hypothetical protein BC939DRAFT_458821 [Gamsiella multidivaricata]
MDPTQDSTDAAYLSMLTRTIPGVGNTPYVPTASKPTSSISHITNKNTATNDLTAHSTHAIAILEHAQQDALFISEGEERFQTVDIFIPSNQSHAPSSLPSTTTTTVTTSSNTAARPLPSESDLLSILKEAQLLPNESDIACEQTTDLHIILNQSNPGSDKIQSALLDLFHYDPTASPTQHPTVALYRVILPSSPTRVHLWILGWVDQHLMGFHTISIET